MSNLVKAAGQLLPSVRRRVLAEIALFLVRLLGPIRAEAESLERAIPDGHAGAPEVGSAVQLIAAAQHELSKCARKLKRRGGSGSA